MSTKVSAEQLEMVKSWAAQGIDLNGIQKLLTSECGLHMTYMDVRFLLLDHGIEIAVAPKPEPKPEEQTSPEPAPTPEPVQPEPQPAADQVAPVTGKPVVELDELQIPGTLMSGKVTFASGTHCTWQIDQMGRFGFRDMSGTPTAPELQAFEFELRQLLSKMM